jgi:uncharacterized protein (DUF952 family)
MATSIYKISPSALWRDARTAGHFDGSPDDIRDGFIHFSTAAQVAGTLERHFKGQNDLVLAEIDTDKLGSDLKFEASSRGTLYPHLYGRLPMTAVVREWQVGCDASGLHVLPADFKPC